MTTLVMILGIINLVVGTVCAFIGAYSYSKRDTHRMTFFLLCAILNFMAAG